MADVAAYRYYDDGGRVYQVALPSDFATALSYESAQPTDAYLPASISPRYATYVSPGNNLWRQVVIPSRAVFVAPPNPVSADGFTWELLSLYGERFALFPAGNFQVIAGPQGPKGDDAPPYTMPRQQTDLTSDIALNVANQWFSIRTLSLEPGVYLILASCLFRTAASAAICEMHVGGVNIIPGAKGAEGYMASASRYLQLVQFFTATVAFSTTLEFSARANITTAVVKAETTDGYRGTHLEALKIG